MLHDLKFKQNITIVFPYILQVDISLHSTMRWLAEAFIVAVLNQNDYFH